MLEQIRYGGAFFCEGVRHVLKIKRTIHYDNVRCLDDSHVNLWLKEAVESGRPFMACRFGSGEMRAFLKTREVRMGLGKTIPEAMRAGAAKAAEIVQIFKPYHTPET